MALTDRCSTARRVAARVRAEVADRVARLRPRGSAWASGTVLVGDDGPSERYVAMKHADCAEVGMRLGGGASAGDRDPGRGRGGRRPLQRRPGVDAYLVQLPLPAGLDEERVLLGRGSRQGRRRAAPDQPRAGW